MTELRAPGELDDFALLVLCGGQSRRMGRDKAALPFGGGTLLGHQEAKARALGIPALRCGPVPHGVPDVFPGRGPLAGLHAGLLACGRPRALVLPVDLPLVPPSELLRLARLHRPGGAQATLAVACGRLQPLCGAFDAALAPRIAGYLASGRGSAHGFLFSLSFRAAPSPLPEASWLNVNTPEDLRGLSEQYPFVFPDDSFL